MKKISVKNMSIVWKITIPLLLIAGTCYYLWNYSESWKDFGLNALTETLGILVTILFVDYLLRKQEMVRQLPQQARAYEDIRLLVTHIISFWAAAYRHCIPGPGPQDLSQLFRIDSFQKIKQNLNLDSTAPVLPSRKWWDFFPQNLQDFRERADKLLMWHHHTLDPEAYSAVHIIATEGMDPRMISTIRSMDLGAGFPRPTILGSYWAVFEDYLQAILQLVRWCQSKHKFLEERGMAGLQEVVMPDLKWENSEADAMIHPEELERQAKAMEEFRKSGKKSYP